LIPPHEIESSKSETRNEAVFLKVGDKDTIRARFEEGRSREDEISAGQYVRFPVGKELSKCFK
jgi:hypothetical protein